MAGITARMGRFVLKRDDRARDYFYLEDGETTIPEGFLRDNQPYAETLRAIQRRRDYSRYPRRAKTRQLDP